MCVSGVRSRVVSCERVCVSCEWASRRSSVVRREAFSFALCVVWDSEVFVSCFEFEFLFRICRRIFDSGFEFKFLEFSCRILNSPFSFRCSIRLLEFRCSIRFLESDFEFVVEFDFSNFVSNFKFEFVVEICRRNFRFVALFDFSKLEFSIRISNFEFVFFVSLLYSISRISLLYSTSRNRSSNSTSRSSTSRFKCLEFRIRLDLFDFSNFDSNSSSKFRFEIVVEIVVLEVAFFIWVLNWTLQFSSKFDNYQCYYALTSSIILARSLSLRSRCHASFARAFRA